MRAGQEARLHERIILLCQPQVLDPDLLHVFFLQYAILCHELHQAARVFIFVLFKENGIFAYLFISTHVHWTLVRVRLPTFAHTTALLFLLVLGSSGQVLELAMAEMALTMQLGCCIEARVFLRTGVHHLAVLLVDPPQVYEAASAPAEG